MDQLRILSVPRRALNGAFHDYVRGVFADRSPRQRALGTRRALWLNGFAPRAFTSAEQRWEDEGGRTG